MILDKKIFDISITDTFVLKGIALLLLLWHHLFYIGNPSLFDDIEFHGWGICLISANLAKVCVAIFVFLSGYGLTVKHFGRKLNVREFFRHRFVKLYKSYWLIWLLFVPIGFVFYDWTLYGVYGEHAWAKLFIQLIGLQDIFGYYGVNGTWWFITCIILLYLSFPILNSLNWMGLSVATCLSVLLMVFPFGYARSIECYLIAFIIGIWIGRLKDVALPRVMTYSIFWCFLTLFLVVLRIYYVTFPYTVADWALALSMIMMYKSLGAISVWLERMLVFIGKHSMNIFLFHTFIYGYYWSDLIYWSRNPFVIFFTLLSICIVVSVVIELLKSADWFKPVLSVFGRWRGRYDV